MAVLHSVAKYKSLLTDAPTPLPLIKSHSLICSECHTSGLHSSHNQPNVTLQKFILQKNTNNPNLKTTRVQLRHKRHKRRESHGPEFQRRGGRVFTETRACLWSLHLFFWEFSDSWLLSVSEGESLALFHMRMGSGHNPP